jgi:hypothetical protein
MKAYQIAKIYTWDKEKLEREIYFADQIAIDPERSDIIEYLTILYEVRNVQQKFWLEESGQ